MRWSESSLRRRVLSSQDRGLYIVAPWLFREEKKALEGGMQLLPHEGWLESENNLADEYAYCVRKFGPERALKVMRAMLKNYQHSL